MIVFDASTVVSAALKAECSPERVLLKAEEAELFALSVPVTDCRDLKDNRYFELALAAGAEIIVSSDDDLLVLQSLARRAHPAACRVPGFLT